MRAAIYSRYSSELQREASIEDQVRLCVSFIEQQGWQRVATFSDSAMSGASKFRPAYQSLLDAAAKGEIDVVVSEALDRLSRDQEDVAGLFKRLRFCGVRIVTLAEGEITELHIGLKGTMNALFLKDLAAKTKRGLEGRIRKGRSAGGTSYGYATAIAAAQREQGAGARQINPPEAEIVRRIFRDYAQGKSPKRIAAMLNSEGVPGPTGGTWGFSTIIGSAKRANGILNNELYAGRLVWNRQRFIKDPSTGRRVSRPNPRSQWITVEVPELRIVEASLWEDVKERQREVAALRGDSAWSLQEKRRPKYLLSGLARCSICGSRYTMISRDHMGCAAARNKGTCTNRQTIRRDQLEGRVVAVLSSFLADPIFFREFAEAFTAETNRVRAAADSVRSESEAELNKIDRDLGRLVDAILEGVSASSIKERMGKLEQRKADLKRRLERSSAPPPFLHPNMAALYRAKLDGLHEALSREDTRAEAAGLIASMVNAIRIIPGDGPPEVEIQGDLAGLLETAASKQKGRYVSSGPLQETLVAGLGFEPRTFRL